MIIEGAFSIRTAFLAPQSKDFIWWTWTEPSVRSPHPISETKNPVLRVTSAGPPEIGQTIASLKRALNDLGDTTKQKCLPIISLPEAGSNCKCNMSPRSGVNPQFRHWASHPIQRHETLLMVLQEAAQITSGVVGRVALLALFHWCQQIHKSRHLSDFVLHRTKGSSWWAIRPICVSTQLTCSTPLVFYKYITFGRGWQELFCFITDGITPAVDWWSDFCHGASVKLCETIILRRSSTDINIGKVRYLSRLLKIIDFFNLLKINDLAQLTKLGFFVCYQSHDGVAIRRLSISRKRAHWGHHAATF